MNLVGGDHLRLPSVYKIHSAVGMNTSPAATIRRNRYPVSQRNNTFSYDVSCIQVPDRSCILDEPTIIFQKGMIAIKLTERKRSDFSPGIGIPNDGQTDSIGGRRCIQHVSIRCEGNRWHG